MNILSVYSKKYLACTRGALVGMRDEWARNARYAERVGQARGKSETRISRSGLTAPTLHSQGHHWTQEHHQAQHDIKEAS